MTFAPQELLDWRSYMKTQTGLPAESLGITGGPGHVETGTSYHLGADQLKMWKDPYSARYPRDVAGLSNAASASDTGWFDRLIELTAWCVAEARAGRRPDTRELIGPGGDGRAYRWASENGWRAEIRSDGDDHESHLHESWWRDSEHRDKVGFYRPFFEGSDMSFTDFHATQLSNVERYEQAQLGMRDAEGISDTVTVGPRPNLQANAIKEIQAGVAELKTRPPVSSAPVDPAALKAVLLDPEVLAAQAEATIDEYYRRLKTLTNEVS